jgi:hypothetical protein
LRLTIPCSAEINELEPLFKGMALRYISSLHGIPLEMAVTVAIDSGSSTRSCLATAFYCFFELSIFFLEDKDARLCSFSSRLHCAEKVSVGGELGMPGIRWIKSPTFQYLFVSFRIMCTYWVSLPMSMLASMSLTT